MAKNLEIAFFVTVFCFLMAYPIAHLLATLPMKYSNLLMICVLLPFWTSLLVRTASWMILLQQQGIVNDFFVMIGLVTDDLCPPSFLDISTCKNSKLDDFVTTTRNSK